MSQTADHPTVQLAADIAYHLAEYEKAFRLANGTAMAKHWQTLDNLCVGNTAASIMRGACSIAAAATRGTTCMLNRDTNVEHFSQPEQREQIISDYVEGLHDDTRIELALVA